MFQDCDAECLLGMFGPLRPKEAAALLSDAPDGSFVLRNHRGHPNNVIVTMKHPTKGIQHLGISYDKEGWKIRTDRSGRIYSTLEEAVKNVSRKLTQPLKVPAIVPYFVNSLSKRNIKAVIWDFDQSFHPGHAGLYTSETLPDLSPTPTALELFQDLQAAEIPQGFATYSDNVWSDLEHLRRLRAGDKENKKLHGQELIEAVLSKENLPSVPIVAYYPRLYSKGGMIDKEFWKIKNSDLKSQGLKTIPFADLDQGKLPQWRVLADFFNVAPQEILIIEDSKANLDAAKKAGYETLAVRKQAGLTEDDILSNMLEALQSSE